MASSVVRKVDEVQQIDENLDDDGFSKIRRRLRFLGATLGKPQCIRKSQPSTYLFRLFFSNLAVDNTLATVAVRGGLHICVTVSLKFTWGRVVHANGVHALV